MKEKDPNKIDAIFCATLKLAGKIGISGLKMSDIAKKANIASGTLYIYFSSKEELLNNLYQTLKRKQSYLAEETQDKIVPLKIKFKNVWTKSLMYWVNNYSEVVFLEQFYYSPFINEESKALSYEVKKYLFYLLETGKENMIIKNLDNYLLLCVLSGFLKETTFYCVQNNVLVDDQLIEKTFSICWDALKA